MALTPEHKLAVFRHLLAHLPLLRHRDYLIELLTGVERVHGIRVGKQPFAITLNTETPVYAGKLIAVGDEPELYSITALQKTDKPQHWQVDAEPTGIPNTAEVLLAPDDPIELSKAQVINLPEEKLTTSVGRLILNYLILIDPFGSLFPFQDKRWNGGDIGNLIADQIIKNEVTVEQLKRYVANMYFIGHATELAVPVYSKKALIQSPDVVKRRQELMAQHAQALAAGDEVVMSQIEQELIRLDKAFFEGDPAANFLIQGKNWNVHRKKMFGTGGMVEGFGQGGYAWIGQPLAEGMAVKDIPTVVNEIRRGSFGRAIETAKGGEEAKFLMRVFQNTRITEEDCGTKQAMPTYLYPNQLSMFAYRTAVVEGQSVKLTPESLKQYAGKLVGLRSPMTCQAKSGYCFTCMGEIFRTLNQDRVVMVVTGLSEYFTTLALKSMHGQSVATTEITSLNAYTF